jgi:uncharacterized protein involved in outer membrane biogenesis
VFDLGPIDAKLRLAGSTLAHVYPFLRLHPPPSRPYRLETHLTQSNKEYRFAQLRGRVGETDIAGEATYDRSKERPLVRASLRSEAADLADLSALVGLHYAPRSRDNAGSKGSIQASDDPEQSEAATRMRTASRVFPDRPFRIDRLKAVDAYVHVIAKKLKAQTIRPLESLNAVAELTQGMLELKSLDIGVAGGHLTGSLTFDARPNVPSARATIELRDVRLQKLVPSLAVPAQGVAPIRGHIVLSGQGRSVASVLAHASGSLAARIDGGRISNLADAKLGLNIGKVLSLMIRGDRDIDLHCGAIAFDVRQGSGKSKAIVVDTEQTRTEGVGTIDLREERWDILLTPQPKKPGLLTRRGSIRTHGTFRTAQISVQERVVIGHDTAGNAASADRNACGAVRTAAAAIEPSRGSDRSTLLAGRR